MTEAADQSAPAFHIQIDREHFTVHQRELTGAQLRQLPAQPIGPHRDLFEVIPGQPDRKIENGQEDAGTDGLLRPGKQTAPGL